jgi:RNA polymerase sigma-70 factor, ECF subfamily
LDSLIKREAAQRLRSSLSALPAAQAEVIVLAYYGQLTHREIAERLGLPAGTVKSRMRLGPHSLRIAALPVDPETVETVAEANSR